MPLSMTGTAALVRNSTTSSRDRGKTVSGVGIEYCLQRKYICCLLESERASPAGWFGKRNSSFSVAAWSATKRQLLSSVGMRIGRDPILRLSRSNQSTDSSGEVLEISQMKF